MHFYLVLPLKLELTSNVFSIAQSLEKNTQIKTMFWMRRSVLPGVVFPKPGADVNQSGERNGQSPAAGLAKDDDNAENGYVEGLLFVPAVVAVEGV